jgi:hypothetical protein
MTKYSPRKNTGAAMAARTIRSTPTRLNAEESDSSEVISGIAPASEPELHRPQRPSPITHPHQKPHVQTTESAPAQQCEQQRRRSGDEGIGLPPEPAPDPDGHE